jgi:hypothetical protein
MLGYYYCGYPYCADAPSFRVVPPPATRPDCGGILGTATLGQRYLAGHIQCGEIPPPPPIVTRVQGWAAPTPSVSARLQERRDRLRRDEQEMIETALSWLSQN